MLCIAFALSAQPAQKGNASAQGKMNRQQQKERLQAEHIAYLTDKLELTPEEAEVFWPVYNKAKAEQKESNKAINEAKKALRTAVKEGKTEKEISDALNDFTKAKSKQRNVMIEYKDKFVKAIGAVKTAKFYLAEESFRNSQLHKLGGKGQGGQRPQWQGHAQRPANS